MQSTRDIKFRPNQQRRTQQKRRCIPRVASNSGTKHHKAINVDRGTHLVNGEQIANQLTEVDTSGTSSKRGRGGRAIFFRPCNNTNQIHEHTQQTKRKTHIVFAELRSETTLAFEGYLRTTFLDGIHGNPANIGGCSAYAKITHQYIDVGQNSQVLRPAIVQHGGQVSVSAQHTTGATAAKSATSQTKNERQLRATPTGRIVPSNSAQRKDGGGGLTSPRTAKTSQPGGVGRVYL